MEPHLWGDLFKCKILYCTLVRFQLNLKNLNVVCFLLDQKSWKFWEWGYFRYRRWGCPSILEFLQTSVEKCFSFVYSFCRSYLIGLSCFRHKTSEWNKFLFLLGIIGTPEDVVPLSIWNLSNRNLVCFIKLPSKDLFRETFNCRFSFYFFSCSSFFSCTFWYLGCDKHCASFEDFGNIWFWR